VQTEQKTHPKAVTKCTHFYRKWSYLMFFYTFSNKN